MRIRTVVKDTGRTLKIWASEYLDFRLHSDFTNVALAASYAFIDDIEVDLQETREIRDSGLALLLMLRRKTAQGDRRIRLINCPDELQNRLNQYHLDDAFQIVAGS